MKAVAVTTLSTAVAVTTSLTYNNDPTTTSGIIVHLAAGTVTGDATVGTDTIRHVEAVRGTNFDDMFDATGFGLAGAPMSASGDLQRLRGRGRQRHDHRQRQYPPQLPDCGGERLG